MWHRNRRSLRRKDLRLEVLETRELLSSAASLARPPISKAPLLIYGSLEGQGEKLGTPGRGSFSFGAAGPEAPLGVGTFQGTAQSRTVLVNGEIMGYNLNNGSATLTAGNGDKLNIQYAGNLYQSGPNYAFTWSGNVVGGTGAFRGARGRFDTYGTYSFSTDQFTDLSYTITLTHR